MSKNIPEGMREFDLELARQMHPLVTRNGKPAKFIAYVENVQDHTQLVFQVEDQVVLCFSNGKWAEIDNWRDVFLAPLGHCCGLPVFAGDIVLCGGQKFSPPIGYSGSWDDLSWPKQKPVVETRMKIDELFAVLQSQDRICIHSAEVLANKAIERAIADGDVIPTAVVEDLFYKAVVAWQDGDFYSKAIQKVLREYKEGLK